MAFWQYTVMDSSQKATIPKRHNAYKLTSKLKQTHEKIEKTRNT